MHGVLQISVEFMKWKHMAPLCPYDNGYNAWQTRCNVNRRRNTLRSPLGSYFFLDKGLWKSYVRNNSIGFDNSCCKWRLVVYRGATLHQLRHRADQIKIPIPASPMLNFSDHWIDSQDESKSFKIIFLCRTVKSSISLHIWPILGDSYPLANLPFIHQCMPSVGPTLFVTFQ